MRVATLPAKLSQRNRLQQLDLGYTELGKASL